MPTLPMFPLGTVLLPSVVLPLHVFEPRYRELVEHCLADGREPEFGVVLIERGNEVGGGDTRSMVGTVARILEAAQFPDGRWALGTVGTRRVRVSAWLDDDPFPRAEVADWDDPRPGDDVQEGLRSCVGVLRRTLALAAELGDDVMPATVELSDDPVLASYQAVAVSPLGPSDRQKLLSASSADARIASLRSLLDDEVAVLERRMALEDHDDDGPPDPPPDAPSGGPAEP